MATELTSTSTILRGYGHKIMSCPPSWAVTGHTFKGWYSNRDGTGSQYVVASTYTFNANTDIYASWSSNNYWVTFVKNNSAASGTMSSQKHTYNEPQQLTANAYSLAGHTFDGWLLSAAATDVKYSNKETVSNLTSVNNGTVSLYAKWNVNSYTLSLYASPASYGTVSGSGTYSYNTNVAVSANPQPWCVFDSWSDGGIQSHTVTVSENKSLTATFKLKNFTVTVVPGAADASGGGSFGYQRSTAVQTSNVSLPTRTGYKIGSWAFSGWTGTSPSINGSTVTVPAYTYGDIVITPTWAQDLISITYHRNA